MTPPSSPEEWDVMDEKIRNEIHDFSSNLRDIRRARRQEAKEEDDDDNSDVDVHYEP